MKGHDLIAGYGEVGKALAAIFGERREIVILDPPKGLNWTPVQIEVGGGVEWMHIAFPYGLGFNEAVTTYIRDFRPLYVMIHSTVPIGTTREIALDVLTKGVTFTYSPVRGLHPHLARYLREFPKYFATNGDAAIVNEYLTSAGMQTRIAPSFETLEWMKLWETLEYYNRIAQWQEIERQYENLNLPDDALTAMKEWIFEKRKVYDGDRGLAPIMSGGIVGGHCLVPNLELIKPQLTPALYQWLSKSNEMRKKELQEFR